MFDHPVLSTPKQVPFEQLLCLISECQIKGKRNIKGEQKPLLLGMQLLLGMYFILQAVVVY